MNTKLGYIKSWYTFQLLCGHEIQKYYIFWPLKYFELKQGKLLIDKRQDRRNHIRINKIFYATIWHLDFEDIRYPPGFHRVWIIKNQAHSIPHSKYQFYWSYITRRPWFFYSAKWSTLQETSNIFRLGSGGGLNLRPVV